MYRPLFPGSDERRLLLLSKLLTAFWGLAQMGVALGSSRLDKSVIDSALAVAGFVTGILLGLTALEQLGLAVDPVQRRLVPTDFLLY